MYAFVSTTLPMGASAFVARSRCSTPPAVRAASAPLPSRRRVHAPAATTTTMLAQEALATLPLLPIAEMRVTFPAYLAVFLGVLIPVAFLIILFIQSESRKAGEAAGRGEQ